MSIRILHTADWHIGDFKGPVRDGKNMRFEDTARCLEALCRKAEEVKPELAVISGDIFHQEQVGPVRYGKEVLLAAKTVADLAGNCRYVIAMRGTPNHDGASQWDVLTEIMAPYKNVKVVITPEVIKTDVAQVVCVPGFNKQDFRAKFPGLSADEEDRVWSKNISDIVIGLKGLCDQDKPVFLMSHYTVPGASAEGSQVACFADFEPCIPKEALASANYDGVFLGHLHRPQRIEGIRAGFYSGAVNALRFSDEGQERGFWIHEYDGKCIASSEFTETPYRRFLTLNWNSEAVEDYLNFGKTALIGMGLTDPEDGIADKIVRIKYSCTSEQKKRLNVPVLQTDLEELGAFYVASIEAEQMIEVNNRNILNEESDPLVNLKKWLEEKCYKDVDAIVDLAEPIIAAARAADTTYSMSGVFKPVSIKVTNYRTYKEAEFNFENVTFCTINGVNGAGKSSLFMDAISDCLFETTREGDKASWIRATDDARSGSIEFTFSIGDQTFRVARTRTKSGRGTVNLAQLGDGGEWLNLSKEKALDTNKEIEKVLGMDGMTFRSCALIMQDQYGLFLSASKDERISILAKLLGLGLYDVMEIGTRKKLSEARKSLAALKEGERIRTEQVSEKEYVYTTRDEIKRRIESASKEREAKEAEREKAMLEMAVFQSASDAAGKAKAAYQEADKDVEEKQVQLDAISKKLNDVNKELDASEAIRDGAEKCRAAQADVNRFAEDAAAYKAKKTELETVRTWQESNKCDIETLKRRKEAFEAKIASFMEAPADLEEKLAELSVLEKKRADLNEKALKAMEVRRAWQEKSEGMRKEIYGVQSDIKAVNKEISRAQEQAEYMKESGCIDSGKANCKFLASAKRIVDQLPEHMEQLDRLTKRNEELINDFDNEKAAASQTLSDIGFSQNDVIDTQHAIDRLRPYKELQKELEKQEVQKAGFKAQIAEVNKNIAEREEKGSELLSRALTITESVGKLVIPFEKHRKALETEKQYRAFLDLEARIPVLEERKTNLTEQRENAEEALNAARLTLVSKLTEYHALADKLTTVENPETKLNAINSELRRISEILDDMNVGLGKAEQTIRDIEKLKDEIAEVKGQISSTSLTVTRYEVLKAAFGQDGVPHQIIRNVIPYITQTANNILGSMTGGKMGVEFVLDKITKGKDGEKATLDVLIEEYGKTRLPYASKSGGEKVKASLAVILALAEVKTGSSGVQLGMLSIDEPPFLDSEGTEAYVDALEAIRDRYPNVKVMAISHDENFKARFSQSVTVIKTDEGSKVIED